MESRKSLVDALKQARLAKLEQVTLLTHRMMRVTLHGIDVTDATLGELREEAEMIEAVLRELGVAIEG
jgi:hypothetical protein